MKRIEDMTESELMSLMNMIGRLIVAAAESEDIEKPHFVLLLFNDPKVSQYVSNCVREDVVLALREGADRLEKNQDVTR